MMAPGSRGADFIVRTTVATPAVPPARQTVSSSSSTSRTIEVYARDNVEMAVRSAVVGAVS